MGISKFFKIDNRIFDKLKNETKKEEKDLIPKDLIENDIKNIKNAESFTIPDIKKVKGYIESFNKILSNKFEIVNRRANDLFSVVKFIDQKSANGSIYIVKVKESKSKYSKLLIKVAKNERADPASYEYYIGLGLNELRAMNILNFSLVYGRFTCGFNSTPPLENEDLSKRLLCDNNKQSMTHILYEYISTESGNPMTLNSYIERLSNSNEKTEVYSNLMNIVIMLMISLQHAQDRAKFTHYDLHLDNILVVKLNASYKFKYGYGNQIYEIMLDHFPFIIDYGRSHIDENLINKITNNKIIDTDTFTKGKKEYSSFGEYAERCWKGKEFYIDPERSKFDNSLYNEIVHSNTGKLKNKTFRKDVTKIINKKFKTELEEGDLDLEYILDAFYENESGQGISHNINPLKFNSKFDFYRFTRLVCNKVQSTTFKSNFWQFLDIQLEDAYPFFIPVYYHLPTDYESITGDFNKPIDIANYIYDITSEFIKNTGNKIGEISYKQLGGSMIRSIEKVSNSDIGRIHEECYKKMK